MRFIQLDVKRPFDLGFFFSESVEITTTPYAAMLASLTNKSNVNTVHLHGGSFDFNNFIGLPLRTNIKLFELIILNCSFRME
jgi:hypothetical protein